MSPPLRPISLPAKFLNGIARDVADYNRRVLRRKNLEAGLPAFAAATQRGGLEMLAPFLARFAQPKILEIGSGYGFGLCFLLHNGFDVIGVEPGNTPGFNGRYDSACDLLRHNGIEPETRLFSAVGESLPFPDASFDLVFSIAVLEHVRDPDRVMTEALRVCRPGGYVVMNVPNYDCFYEGHYNIFWLPYLLRKKPVAAAYVSSLWRRDPYFVHELNFTVPGDFTGAKSWAAATDQLDVHPFLFRPLLYVSAVAWFLSLKSYARSPVLRWFAPGGFLRWLHGPTLGLTRIFTSFCTVLGLAPVFNVVARKRISPN
jgi:SAM-dependent methyltransferase